MLPSLAERAWDTPSQGGFSCFSSQSTAAPCMSHGWWCSYVWAGSLQELQLSLRLGNEAGGSSHMGCRVVWGSSSERSSRVQTQADLCPNSSGIAGTEAALSLRVSERTERTLQGCQSSTFQQPQIIIIITVFFQRECKYVSLSRWLH